MNAFHNKCIILCLVFTMIPSFAHKQHVGRDLPCATAQQEYRESGLPEAVILQLIGPCRTSSRRSSLNTDPTNMIVVKTKRQKDLVITQLQQLCLESLQICSGVASYHSCIYKMCHPDLGIHTKPPEKIYRESSEIGLVRRSYVPVKHHHGGDYLQEIINNEILPEVRALQNADDKISARMQRLSGILTELLGKDVETSDLDLENDDEIKEWMVVPAKRIEKGSEDGNCLDICSATKKICIGKCGDDVNNCLASCITEYQLCVSTCNAEDAESMKFNSIGRRRTS